MLGIIVPTDELIFFQRGGYTTNQILWMKDILHQLVTTDN